MNVPGSMQPVQMNIPETKPLIDRKGQSKYVKYSFITTREVKTDLLDSVSESFDVQITKSNTCSSIGGLLCIVIAVLDWVLMSEIIQSSEENTYNKPFLIRFMVNSSYAVLFIPWICVYSFNKRLIANNMTFTHWMSPEKSRQQSRGRITPNDAVISYGSSAVDSDSSVCHLHNINSGELVMDHAPNTFHIFLSLILVNFVSLSSGYIWYLSLSRTVAAINNTVFQSNCVFVLIYSYFLLNEPFTSKRLFAALLAVGGVVLISFTSNSDTQSSSTSSLFGIILCVISMMSFALFEVLFKYFGYLFFRFGYELSDTLLFQSGIGLCNIVLFWPFLMLLNYFHIEEFELPTNYDQFIHAIALPCALDVVFTCALLCGITLSGALFMSIGLILVIPITFFADIVIFQKATISIINIYSVIGAALIIAGFIIIQIDHNHATDHDNQHAPHTIKENKKHKKDILSL